MQNDANLMARQELRRSSQAGNVEGMRRSVGMRDSMCLFLQLEGASEGQNGFEPEEVLKVKMISSCFCLNDELGANFGGGL